MVWRIFILLQSLRTTKYAKRYSIVLSLPYQFNGFLARQMLNVETDH